MSSENTYDSGGDAGDADGAGAGSLAIALGVGYGLAENQDGTAGRSGGGRALGVGGADGEGGSARDDSEDGSDTHVGCCDSCEVEKS